MLDTAAALLGETHVLEAESPSMGAEDFSYFIEHTPGAFFHLGCADPAHMPAPPLHSRALCWMSGAWPWARPWRWPW